VDNIMEIEPVVKKETVIATDEKPVDEPAHPPVHDDPAQMKLEL